MADERSRRVAFLSHCLLNQNTRHLGGAFRAGAVDAGSPSCGVCRTLDLAQSLDVVRHARSRSSTDAS